MPNAGGRPGTYLGGISRPNPLHYAATGPRARFNAAPGPAGRSRPVPPRQYWSRSKLGQSSTTQQFYHICRTLGREFDDWTMPP